MLKKWLRALRGSSIHLNEQKFPVNICPETSAYEEMCDVYVISTAVAPCGSHAFQHNFWVFVTQRCVLCQ